MKLLPQSVLYTQSAVRSPYFILTGLSKGLPWVPEVFVAWFNFRCRSCSASGLRPPSVRRAREKPLVPRVLIAGYEQCNYY